MTRRYYAVLAKVSLSYSPLQGRLVTCYSPVRHCTQVLLPFLVRLACVRHAASVDSEPGSNSRLKLFASPDDGGHRGLTCTTASQDESCACGDLPCEKIQAKAACLPTTGTFNLLSKILATLRLSGAVWIEAWRQAPSCPRTVAPTLSRFAFASALHRRERLCQFTASLVFLSTLLFSLSCLTYFRAADHH